MRYWVLALHLAVTGLLLLSPPTVALGNLEFGNRTQGWLELISWKPRALVLHGFLADAECDHIIQLAEPRLEPSKVVSRDGSGRLDPVRTSHGTFLRKDADAVMAAVQRRIELATHLPFSHSEQIQVLRYELGQKYSAHFDVHGSEQQTVLEARRGVKGGQRYATLLMYLSDVEGGGETCFPRGVALDGTAQVQLDPSECTAQGVAVKPRKGDALFFYSLKPDGRSKDARSLHAGCPVQKGVKYSATSWLHVEPFGAGAPQHPGVCRDNNPACPKWAAAGECAANPTFMRGTPTHRGHCRLSCKVCRPCAERDDACLDGNLTPGELEAWLRQAASRVQAAAAAA